MTDLIASFTGWNWAAQAFGVVFAAALLDWTQRRALRRLQRKLETTTRNPWDDSLVGAARKPLSLLIWMLGILFAARIAHRATAAPIFELIDPVRDLGVVAVFTWFLLRLERRLEWHYSERAKGGELAVDGATLESLGKLLRIALFSAGGLAAAQTLGYSIAGLLAFGGVGGIAVGFAARDLLANLFGGFMIFLDRPFAVGDWIRSPDREIEGTVEQISWRLTRIRTPDMRPLYVPNATFSTITVENPSRMSHRRIKETIGIRYQDAAKMAVIVTDVKAMLRAHPDIAADQTLTVAFDKFALSSLDFFIYAFTHTTEWVRYHEVKQDVLLKVIEIVHRHGADVAFPTSTVHIPDGVVMKEPGEGQMKWEVEMAGEDEPEPEVPSWKKGE